MHSHPKTTPTLSFAFFCHYHSLLCLLVRGVRGTQRDPLGSQSHLMPAGKNTFVTDRYRTLVDTSTSYPLYADIRKIIGFTRNRQDNFPGEKVTQRRFSVRPTTATVG